MSCPTGQQAVGPGAPGSDCTEDPGTSFPEPFPEASRRQGASPQIRGRFLGHPARRGPALGRPGAVPDLFQPLGGSVGKLPGGGSLELSPQDKSGRGRCSQKLEPSPEARAGVTGCGRGPAGTPAAHQRCCSSASSPSSWPLRSQQLGGGPPGRATFVCEHRRPVAQRAQRTGIWFHILEGLCAPAGPRGVGGGAGRAGVPRRGRRGRWRSAWGLGARLSHSLHGSAVTV